MTLVHREVITECKNTEWLLLENADYKHSSIKNVGFDIMKILRGHNLNNMGNSSIYMILNCKVAET